MSYGGVRNVIKGGHLTTGKLSGGICGQSVICKNANTLVFYIYLCILQPGVSVISRNKPFRQIGLF